MWMALSADHGIAPVSAEAAKLGINAAYVNMEALYANLNPRAERALFARGKAKLSDARARSSLPRAEQAGI